MAKNSRNGSIASVVYKLVLEAARKVDGDEGATICEMNTYLRENGCVKLNDKDLGTAIRDALKQGIQEGVLKQDYCTKKYYAVTPAKIERSKKPYARKSCSCGKQKIERSKKPRARKPCSCEEQKIERSKKPRARIPCSCEEQKIERSKKPRARKSCSCEEKKTTDSCSACEEDDDEDDDFSCCNTCSSSDSEDSDKSMSPCPSCSTVY